MGQAREFLRVLEVPGMDVHRRRRYVRRRVRGQEDLGGGKDKSKGNTCELMLDALWREAAHEGLFFRPKSHPPALPPHLHPVLEPYHPVLPVVPRRPLDALFQDSNHC